MSLNMIIAFVMGFVVVIGSIVSATDRPSMFIDIPSIIVVFGGTFVTLFISFELKTALAALKLVGQSFRRHKDSEMSLKDEVGRIVRWGYIIQKNGLQGLENEVTEQLREENPFLAYGADLVVTGYTGAEIKQILTYMMESEAERAKGPVDALKTYRLGYHAGFHGWRSIGHRPQYGRSLDYHLLRHHPCSHHLNSYWY